MATACWTFSKSTEAADETGEANSPITLKGVAHVCWSHALTLLVCSEHLGSEPLREPKYSNRNSFFPSSAPSQKCASCCSDSPIVSITLVPKNMAVLTRNSHLLIRTVCMRCISLGGNYLLLYVYAWTHGDAVAQIALLT